MSEEKKYEIAKEYVDKQLDTMKRFDAAPKQFSRAEYDSLIKQVARTIRVTKDKSVGSR